MNARLTPAKVLLAAVCALAVISSSACTSASATPPPAAQASPPPATALAPENDLLGYTCSDYLHALDLADPGANPTADRQAAALNAQDDLVNAMMWLHGYQTGRDGPAAAAVPLTRSWMVENVGKLADACVANSPDGSLPLASAVAKL